MRIHEDILRTEYLIFEKPVSVTRMKLKYIAYLQNIGNREPKDILHDDSLSLINKMNALVKCHYITITKIVMFLTRQVYIWSKRGSSSTKSAINKSNKFLKELMVRIIKLEKVSTKIPVTKHLMVYREMKSVDHELILSCFEFPDNITYEEQITTNNHKESCANRLSMLTEINRCLKAAIKVFEKTKIKDRI